MEKFRVFPFESKYDVIPEIGENINIYSFRSNEIFIGIKEVQYVDLLNGSRSNQNATKMCRQCLVLNNHSTTSKNLKYEKYIGE